MSTVVPASDLKARRVIRWIQKYLLVTQGPRAGEKFKLLPFQRRFIYGVMRNQEAALTIGRGNGKTTLASALGSAALVGPLSVPRGQVVIVAATMGQAHLAFEHVLFFLKPAIEAEPRRWRKIDNAHNCLLTDTKTGSWLRVFGGNPKPAHGLAPLLVIADEPAKWDRNKGPRMHAAMLTALGKHAGSKFIAIGTRPRDSHHWFSRMLLGGPGIYAQYHAATDGGADFSRYSIKAANPAIGHMPELAETLEREKKLAIQYGGRALHRWRALRLNRGTPELGESEKIVTAENWNACVCGRGKAMPERSGPVAIGFDLGGSSSMTAFAAYWPETGRFEVRGAFGADPSLLERGHNDFVGDRYTIMKRRGELTLYPGKVTPVGPFLIDCAEQVIGDHEVIGAVADRYRQAEAEQAMAIADLQWEVDWRGVGRGEDGIADIRGFKSEVLDAHVRTKRSLLMESAIMEAVIVRDTNQGPSLDKSRRQGRIDALQAAVLAVSLGRRWRLPSPDGTIVRSEPSDFMMTDF